MSRRPNCLGLHKLYKVCLQLRDSCVSRFVTSVPNRRLGSLHHMPHLQPYPTTTLQLRQTLNYHQWYIISACANLFSINILEDRDHRLHHLLPDSHSYTLRHARTFDIKFKTCRPKNYIIFNSQCLRVNSFRIATSYFFKKNTLFLFYIFYVYVDILSNYNFF